MNIIQKKKKEFETGVRQGKFTNKYGDWYETKIKNLLQNIQAFNEKEAKQKALIGWGKSVAKRGIPYGWVGLADVKVKKIIYAR